MRPPARTMETLNTLFLDELETEHYFTMLLADVDLGTGRVRMVQAGHPHPIVQRRCGRCESVGTGGLPVGLIDGARYEDVEVQLGAGDRMMIHSDGIVECPDASGRLLGDEGAMGLLGDLRQTRGMACLESLVWKMSDFAGKDRFDDDVSAALLEFTGVGTV